MIKRIIDYKIDKNQNESAKTVKDFLKDKGYSSQILINLKKEEGSICLNGQPSYMNHPLTCGDIITVRISENKSSEKIPAVNLPLNIVYEDEDILVVNKPCDMPIHPSMNNYENSLANAVAYYYEQQSIPFIFRCINRLDRDTSGLTVIAKHMLSAGILSDMVAKKSSEQGLSRQYLAIVRGYLPEKKGIIEAPIARKDGSVIERVVDFERGEQAITCYEVIKEENGHSLVSLMLKTGRTHQIRVHMKYLGYPLIGDYLYNPDMENISRQALHSYRLMFTHPITGKPMEFTAPLPDDMSSVISL